MEVLWCKTGQSQCFSAERQEGDGWPMPELCIAAKTENMERVLEFMNEQLEAHGCSSKTKTQLNIAADELFTNIAHYAYGGQMGQAVIQMEFPDDFAEITFRDWGIPYNPLQHPDPDVTLPTEERPIGGLGIFMVKKSMDFVDYRREAGQNILTIRRKLCVSPSADGGERNREQSGRVTQE